MSQLLTSTAWYKAIDEVYDERSEPACFEGLWVTYAGYTEAGKEFYAFSVRTINVEEKRFII